MDFIFHAKRKTQVFLIFFLLPPSYFIYQQPLKLIKVMIAVKVVSLCPVVSCALVNLSSISVVCSDLAENC